MPRGRKPKVIENFPEKVKELAEQGYTYRQAVVALKIAPNKFVKLMADNNLNWLKLRRESGFTPNGGGHRGKRKGAEEYDLPGIVPLNELAKLVEQDMKPNLPIRMATPEEMEKWFKR